MEATTSKAPKEVSTKQPTARNSVPKAMQNMESETEKVVTGLQQMVIQDKRYKHILDDLPNVRIQGYHTYHRTMDVGGHGMVTIIKRTIPLEEAVQINLGNDTETLSTRIWLNNKNQYYYTIFTERMENWK